MFRQKEREKQSETLINRKIQKLLGNNTMIKEHQKRVFGYLQYCTIIIIKLFTDATRNLTPVSVKKKHNVYSFDLPFKL